LRSLNRDYGLTFVIVTHDPQIANETDRIVSMRNGQIEKETATGTKVLNKEAGLADVRV